MKLKQTLTYWLAGFVFVTQGATLAIALRFAYVEAMESATTSLRVAVAVAHSFLDERKRLLDTSVSTLARDFALRSAAASGDTPTLESALRNHAARIQADSALFIGPDGDVRAWAGERFVFAPDIWQQMREEPHRMILLPVSGRDTLHQMVVVPVRAPDRIGWVTMGFEIDDAVAMKLGSITGTEVAFVPATDAEEGRVFASTPNVVASEERLTISEPTMNIGVPTIMVLSRSEAEALAGFDALVEFTVWLSVLAFVASVLVAYGLSRGVTGSLTKLATVAKRIRDGDYSDTPMPSVSGDEVRGLAGALDAMQKGIVEREGQIRHRAMHDALTDLPNQERALAELDQWWADGTPSVAMVVQVDGLQELNSWLGLETGDEVIVELARQLLMADIDFVARVTYTRFLLLLKTDSRRRAESLAHRLFEDLRLVSVGPEMEVSLRPVIGAATSSGNVDGQALIRNAWSASLDAATTPAAPISWYDDEHRNKRERRMTIMRDLPGAIERNDLTVAYQPKWSVTNKRYVGAEALARWNHPVLGNLPPDEFVGVAEQTREIQTLTRWVLGRALDDLQPWRADGRPFTVAVNISAHDLHDPRFSQVVENMLRERRLPGEALQLEVTESALMSNLALATQTLLQLTHAGVGVAIDDYGTGFSSLSQLKRLPTRTLKIDKSFVMHLSHSERDQHIVKSTIELAHSLGMAVVAEGVEDQDAMAMLTLWDCDVLQGYYLSKPVPASEITGLLTARSADVAALNIAARDAS